jgi:serine-type D-Ala-D-Ala carboxypeptidase/endopeptidase (penicillin-binding protein 4)
VGHIFSTYFQQTGGTFQGKMIQAKCPEAALEILSFPSKPLSQIVFGMNKFSNNFIAEMLLRLIGNSPSPEKGIQTIQERLVKKEILASELRLENASGLSRKNRISANTLATVVRKSVNDLSIGPEFLSSFGINGSEGTLRRRFQDLPQESLVRAKSGSLLGVVSLVGIVKTLYHQEVVFAFIFNVPSKPNWALQQVEENLISILQSSPRNSQ